MALSTLSSMLNFFSLATTSSYIFAEYLTQTNTSIARDCEQPRLNPSY